MPKKVDNKEFSIRLNKVQPNLKLVDKFKKFSIKVKVSDGIWEYICYPQNLLKGHTPDIRSVINPDKYCINNFKNIHGELYDYSLVKYKKENLKIIIICKKHGKFKQTPNSHNNGNGCEKCQRDLAKKRPTSWSYSNWQKAGERSNNFDSFKIYIIKCWNDDEEFYKIGKTFTTVKKRFGTSNTSNKMPYNYEIVELIKDKNAREICKLEVLLQKENKRYKYTPLIKFQGMYECYKKVQKQI